MFRRVPFAAALMLTCVCALGAEAPSGKVASRPTLVAYPFQSAFDQGRLGAKVAKMVMAKARRTGAFATFADAAGTPRKEANVYKHQKRHYPAGEGWRHYCTRPFRPKHPRLQPETLPVMLYAYGKAGTVRFDNVTLKRAAVEHESDTDETMRRAFGEKGKKQDARDKDLVGGTAGRLRGKNEP